MKPFISAIAVAATLMLAPGCSSSVKSEQTSTETINPHSEHSMYGMEMPERSATAEAKLTAPTRLTPGQLVHLAIQVQDLSGKAIANFDPFQTKLMHLIVVSDNLQAFSHLHPTYQDKGRFAVEAIFPQPGGYTLFSDYKPTGQKEQVSVMKTQVPGISSPVPPINLSRSETSGNTETRLIFPEKKLKAGQEIPLTFDLRDKSTNQPITDLQPYLGEKGHLVIVRQAISLTRADYIHAHAAKDVSTSRAEFMTSFPQPGRYKLWGQFNRNGKIVIADFWVNVT